MVTRRDFLKGLVIAAIAPAVSFAGVMKPKEYLGPVYIVFNDYPLKDKPFTVSMDYEQGEVKVWVNDRQLEPQEYVVKKCLR